MIRAEFVVDTKEELDDLSEYITNSVFKLNIGSIDMFCLENNESRYFIQRELEENKYTYYEQR